MAPGGSKSSFGQFVASKAQQLADSERAGGAGGRPSKRKASTMLDDNGGSAPQPDDEDGLEDLSEDDDEEDDEQPKARMPSKRNATSKGRRKIKIQYIDEKNKRHVSFTKRKAGLMKKAYELSTLTGTECLVVCLSETRIFYHFATKGFKPLVEHERGQQVLDAALRNAMDEISAPMPVSATASTSSTNAQSQTRSKKGKSPAGLDFEDETANLDAAGQGRGYVLPHEANDFPSDSLIGSIVPHLPRTYSADSHPDYPSGSGPPLSSAILPPFPSASTDHSSNPYALFPNQDHDSGPPHFSQGLSGPTPYERAAAEQMPLMSRYVATGSAHPSGSKESLPPPPTTSHAPPTTSAPATSAQAAQQAIQLQNRLQTEAPSTNYGMHSFDPSLRAEMLSWNPPADRHGNGKSQGSSIWERDEWQRVERVRREGAASASASAAAAGVGANVRRAVESDVRDAPTPESAPATSATTPANDASGAVSAAEGTGDERKSGSEPGGGRDRKGTDDPFDIKQSPG